MVIVYFCTVGCRIECGHLKTKCKTLRIEIFNYIPSSVRIIIKCILKYTRSVCSNSIVYTSMK